MSESQPLTETTDGTGEDRSDELQLQLELLREENERLRRSYALARRTSYRRSALGLAVVGGLAVIGAVVFPAAREVLLALGGTGLFAAVLTYYLTPERFIAADVGASVYGAMAETEAALVENLGLTDQTVYVPVDSADSLAWLYVPQHTDYRIPDADALRSPLVVGDDPAARGVSFRPTGAPLVRQFDQARTGEHSDDPVTAIEGVVDAVGEQFELAESVSVDVDAENHRATVAIQESAFGPVDRFDHPIQSVLAVGLARALDAPVTSETTLGDNERADYLVTLRWTDSQ